MTATCERCGGREIGESVLTDSRPFETSAWDVRIREAGPLINVSLELLVQFVEHPTRYAWVEDPREEVGIVLMGSMLHLADDHGQHFTYRIAHPDEQYDAMHCVWPD